MDKIEETAAGSRRHSFVGKKGDLRCELHYAAPHPHCGREACLYIYRANAPREGQLLPFCQMWQFDPRPFALRTRQAQLDQRKVAFAAKKLALALYGIENQSDEFRVLDLMADFMGDFKDHKPETGIDTTLDEWLAALDNEGLEFFMEVNGERVIG